MMSEKGMPRWAKLVVLVLIVIAVWMLLTFALQRLVTPVGVIV